MDCLPKDYSILQRSPLSAPPPPKSDDFSACFCARARALHSAPMAAPSCDLAQLAPWATHASRRPIKQLAHVVRNGQPFAFRAPLGGSEVILCLLPKVGSTTWKLALLSALHPRRHAQLLEQSPHRRRGVHRLPRDTSWTTRNRAVRIVVVRNPYDRLLSAYLDKMVLQRKARLAPGNFEPGGSFESFLGNLTRRDPASVDIHYRPMSLQCGMPALSYDYVLRVEEMAAWYEPFVRLLGLEQTVQSGWNVSTKWWRGSAGGCFYVPPGRSCASMFRDPCGAPGQVPGHLRAPPPDPPSAAAGVRPASFHATHAASRRAEFFRGRAARMASRWLQADLARFGYDRIRAHNSKQSLKSM